MTKRMTKPIIVGTDFSPRADKALGRAAWFASHLDRPLRVVHAFRDTLWTNVRRQFSDKDWVFGEPFDTAKVRANDVAAALAQEYGISVAVDVRVGTATQALCAAAEESDAELLVVGEHGENWRGDAYVGGTAHKLLTEAPCPLLVVRHEAAIDYDSALIGIDFSAASIRALRFAAAALPNSALHVAHALVSLGDAQLKAAGADDQLIERYHEIAAESAEKMLAQTIAENLGKADKRVATYIRYASPDSLLREQAQASGGVLVILGRHGQHSGKSLMGSNLINVLHHTECDVLVVP
jgi:nucleotide-binding universal stress UspA family protein